MPVSLSTRSGAGTPGAGLNLLVHPPRRRFLPLLGCLGLLALAPLKPAPVQADPPGGTAGWALTFDDEFTETSLDTAKWDSGFSWDYPNGSVGNSGSMPGAVPTQDSFGANGDVAGYPASNLAFDAKGLSIRLAKEDFKDRRGVVHHYTSGAIETERTFAQIYGYFETNMAVASEQGSDTAFWLYTRDHGGDPLPGINELDVTEVMTGARVNGVIDTAGDIDSTTVHAPGAQTDAQGNPFLLFTPNGSPLGGTPTGTVSHTYGMDWEPAFVKFYLDGKLIHTVNYAAPPAPAQKPMYLILNQELENDALIGNGTGNWFGDPDKVNPYLTIFAHARWVRVWTKTLEKAYPRLPSFPGTIQAANYDTGGSGVAYNQSQTGTLANSSHSTPPLYVYSRSDNSGAAFSHSANGATADGLTSTFAGQWYKYTVEVPRAGKYSLSFAVSGNGVSSVWPFGGQMHLEDWNTATATGTSITDKFYVRNPAPPTGAWPRQTLTNSAPVHLTAGTHVFRWVQDYGDAKDDANLYSMTAKAVSYDALAKPRTPVHTRPLARSRVKATTRAARI